jgi:hypothetical protein
MPSATAIDSDSFVRLKSKEAYGEYFSHMTHVFKCLMDWQRQIQGGEHEKKMVSGFIERILNTILALGRKYTYHPTNSLALDLLNSGYPHLLGIMELENDVRDREEMLQGFLPEIALKDKMIDVMMTSAKDPQDLLWQMSTRQYFNSLSSLSLISSFTGGDFVLLGEAEKRRRYLYSWLCYDFESNVPHIHLMVFEQDKGVPPIHEEGIDQMEFVDVIRANGTRVPDMLVLAAGIDGSLNHIHPKILKRIKLGPILSNAYSHGTKASDPLLGPLAQFGNGKDFILLVRNEILYSKKQSDKKDGFLASLGATKIREVFMINTEDDECAGAKASSIDRQIILPHHVMQHIDFSDPALAKYAAARKIAYNKQQVFVI